MADQINTTANKAIDQGASLQDVQALAPSAGVQDATVATLQQTAEVNKQFSTETTKQNSLQAFATPDVIDSITGERVNVFTHPEEFIQGARKKESEVRKLFALRRINTPEIDPKEIFMQAKVDVDKGNSKQLVQDEILSYSAKQEQAALAAANEVSINDPESINASASILSNLDEFKAKFNEPDAYQQVLVDNNAPESLPSINARRSAVKGRAYEILDDLNDSNDLLDSTLNVIGLFGPDYIKDVSDAFNDGPLGSLSSFSEFARNFNLRDPEEQAVLVEEVVPSFWKAFDGNGLKVAAALTTLFDEGNTDANIGIGVLTDAMSVFDVKAFITTGRSWLAARSLAKQQVDSGAIEEGARLQAAAGAEDKQIAEAIGTTKQDVAHSLNPADTSLVDDGTSLQGVAGEMDSVINQQTKVFTEELLPIAGNKLPRGEMKVVFREKNQLQQKIAQLNKEKEFVTSSGVKSGHKVAQSRTRQLKDINQDIARNEEQLKIVKEKINANKAPVQAEADLSRLEQGVIPPQFKERFDSAVESVKTENRVKATAAKAEVKPTPLKEDEAAIQNIGVVIPKAQTVVDEVSKLIDDIIRPQAFTPEEQTRAIAKAEESLQTELTEAGQSINSMSVISKDGEGTVIKYTTTSGEGERLVKFTREDTGTFIAEGASKDIKQRWIVHFNKFLTPDLLTEQIAPKLVKDVTFAGQQSAKLQKGLVKIWVDAEAGLTKNQKFEVNAILQAGDEEGEVFSIAKLREGLVETTLGNPKFTDRQIESYYQKRAFYDSLHDVRNGVLRAELLQLGYKDLEYVFNGEVKHLLGRPKKNFDLSGVKDNDAIFLPEEANQFVAKASVAKRSEQLKQEGYEVVELFEPITLKSGATVDTALVRRSSKWSGVPDKVLNKPVGYTPRIYRKGMTYVRDMDSGETLYAFIKKDEAKAWAENLGGNVRVFEDREFNAVARTIEDSKAFGGLYTGSRKRRPLMVKHGDKEFRPDRMSTGNATERYIQNISTIVPLNEYRLATLDKWKNTVNQLAKAGRGTGLKEQRFDSVIDLDADIKLGMEQLRDSIRTTVGMQSKEERVSEKIMLGAANIMEGKPFLAPIKNWTLNHSAGKPTSWLKARTHDLLLGMYNPRQVWVQMQNATLAMSISPKHALPAMGETLALRAIVHLPEKEAAEAGKIMGLGDDVLESLAQYKKSGLTASITRQGDFGSVEQGVAHSSFDAVHKLAKGGKIFFNAGENFSRQVSWNIARRKWKELNPGKAIKDGDIVDISQDALRMLLNMQKENSAWWQTAPVLGNMTQFFQVEAKFLENVMPRVMGGSSNWTRAEKVRAVAGQVLLYGTVGVPVAEESVKFVASLLDQTPEEFIKEHPNYTQSINEGFMGMLGIMTGTEDLAPGKNLSLVQGLFNDNVISDLAKGVSAMATGHYSDQRFVETLTGAGATTIKRIGDVASTLVSSLHTLYEVPTLDVAYGALLSNADSVAALTSTWTQARKVVWLHSTGNLMSSRGKVIATKEELGELNLQTQLGMVMGITTDIERDFYASKIDSKKAMQYKKDVQQELQRAQLNYLTTGNLEAFRANKAWLMAPYSPIERQELNNSLIDSIRDAKSGVGKEVRFMQKSYLDSGGRVEPTTAQMQLKERVK